MSVSFAGADGQFWPAGRADIVSHEHAGGRTVFSASSSAHVGRLAHKGHDGNVPRLTPSVPRRFLEPASFSLP